jgi:hypothetical protein
LERGGLLEREGAYWRERGLIGERGGLLERERGLIGERVAYWRKAKYRIIAILLVSHQEVKTLSS